MLMPSEENFLDAFMKALYKINPSLHNNLSHMKRVSVFTWILGWGVYSNARNIAKIKTIYIPFKSKTSCKTNKLNNWLTS